MASRENKDKIENVKKWRHDEIGTEGLGVSPRFRTSWGWGMRDIEQDILIKELL